MPVAVSPELSESEQTAVELALAELEQESSATGPSAWWREGVRENLGVTQEPGL